MDSEDRGVKDEEVGELWRWLNSPAPIDLPLHKECRDLIIKLVEERAWRLLWFHEPEGSGPYIAGPQIGRMRAYIPQALRDFGIDPATWPKEGA